MACINPNNPTFQTLAKKLGSYMLAEVEFSKLQKEDFVIQNNGTFLNTSEEKRKEIFENYVNLMDRKREGKSISFDKFNQMFDNLQVFKHKNTFIFGEWDVKNNVFKGRLISSPGIKELYGALDVLFANTDFVASVPSDIGSMLERKGLYKLDVGKEYNFKGEEMVKNLYFSNKELVEKIFKTTPENVTTEQVKKYDEFFNYWSLINKLKKEYESKNFDNLLSILKEIGIYDYNAYKLVKKLKQDKITDADTETVVKEIIKNSTINKVNIDNTDLINNPKIYGELNTELNKTLATYLSKFGIKTELLEDIQDKLGIDSFAHIDILNKILYADKNNQENYPQQAGKVIAYMMQHNPYMQEITSKMKKLSMFKGLTDDELFEAVGDLISEELHKKTNTELPKDLIESIKNLIKQFFDFLNDIQMSRINKNIGFIADNILLQNQSLITQSVYKPGSVGKKVFKISLEEALKSDAFGNSIVEKMAKYFILTGSITLSEQGTVYRPNENQIHDLDWVSSLTREETIKIFNKLYPNNKYIRNIYNPEYQTDTWLIAPEGYKIENLKIDNSKKTNKIIGYDIVDLNNKIVSSYIPLSDSHTGKVEAKLIDIFSYEKVTEEKTANKEITLDSGTKLKIADWRNTFEAKLKFGRLKDIWDYNRFIPNDNIYTEKEALKKQFKSWVDDRNNFNKELAQKIQDKLEKLYPEIKLNITNNPVWEKGDNVSNQTIENEMGEEYWKELYSNKRLEYREEFEYVRIPTIKNKYKPDYENVYHGTNAYHLDNEGNLILTPSRNFENKTESVSLTQIPIVAQDYMLRKQGNVIIKISNDALPSNYTVESAEEIAINGNKPFIVKKGMFEIIKVQTLAEKMKAKYANEVEQRADELRSRAKSDLHLLDAIYSERIAADNYSEIQEYENDSQREQAPDWYVPDEYLDSRAANKVYSDLKNKINKDWIIKTLSDLLIDQIKNTGEFIPSIESALENISQYGNRNAPHQSTLWEELLSEIGLGFNQTYYSEYNTDEEIAKAREKQKEKQDLIDKIEEIVYASEKSSIDFYNSDEQKQKRAEQKRIDEENHKKFLENLPKYRQEIDDLPFQKINGKIIGQANIKAMTVLVDAINRKADTIPHEYAHHYIAWFRDTPIVQEGIKKWGNEEALVQSIGEQVVKQKGEAYNWWNKFVKWVMNQFNSLSKLQKEELTQILTDAFLTRQDLNNIGNNSFQQFQQSLNKPNTNPILKGNQQEQVKKFAELQERLNNKEFLEGAKNAFESSEELQNVYYEALGYDISNIDLKITKTGNRINVITTSSSNKAKIDIDIEGNNAYITNTFVKKGRQGFGTLSYIKLGNELIKQGLTLTSDLNGVDLQESGKALWESLVSKNLAFYNPNIGRYVFLGQQTLNAYTDYIARVSLGIIKNPSSGEYNYESQVKDIVYHGTDAEFDKFNKSLIGRESIKTGNLGIFFSDDKEVIEQSFLPKRIISSILNIKNPNKLDWQTYMDNILDSPEKIEKKGYDAIIGEKTEEPLFNKRDKSSEFAGNSFIVFEPEQIHILGSKQDIEGFKKFVEQPIIEEIKEIKPEGLPSIDRTNKTCK